jgi:hypothetical protein
MVQKRAKMEVNGDRKWRWRKREMEEENKAKASRGDEEI